MSNLTFPSVYMLPMDDIKKDLSNIFLGINNNSNDTNNVFNVPSNKIAIASQEDDGTVPDRNTVDNAKKLGGIEAKHYLTKEQGEKIETFGQDVSSVLVAEIAALRDELYQLRGELTRNGFVKEYGLYSGFQDFFNIENKKYLLTQSAEGETIELCKLSPNFVNSSNVNKIIPSKSGIIKTGDWFIISKTDTGENYLVQAIEVTPINSEEQVKFISSISSEGIPSIENPTNVIITKVQGNYFNGTFSFSKIERQASTGKERYTMLNDDTSVTLRLITTDKTGYGMQVKIPSNSSSNGALSNVAGALKEFHIVAKASGTPGALTCYLVDSSKYNDISDITTEEIGPDKAVIAKSMPVTYESANTASLTEIAFNFYNNDTSTYPVVEGIKYVFVVVAESCSESNYWSIQFTANDVQTMNYSYNYTSSGLSLAHDIGDLIFSLVTIEIAENIEVPYREGLYTSQLIKVNETSHVSRARLTMRINKEGNYKCNTSGIINDEGVVRLSATGVNPDTLGIHQNDILVIGDQIRKSLTTCDNNNITIDKAISIEENSDIYRIGYQPYIKASKVLWDNESACYVISNEVLVPLKLKAVIKDDKHFISNCSDRLIFECDLIDEDNKLIDANEFTLQIAWKSNLSQSELQTYPSYIGRIYDLTLSFDKTL